MQSNNLRLLYMYFKVMKTVHQQLMLQFIDL